MINLRPILLVNGVLLSILAFAMLIPALVDLVSLNPDWKAFLLSSFLTAFIGVLLILTNRGHTTKLTLRQAFLLTASTWMTLVAFAAFPFLFSELNISYTDAFFETMSGLTTTGSTVFSGLDTMPPGILVWRSLLQWLGGIGIIVLALAILPILKIGGMQLFRTESSDKSDKVLPRATQIAVGIGGIYTAITLLCALLLWMAGMSGFDAINHAMSTASTGGYSTHDASIKFFDSALIEFIIVIFMILSSLPFVLYIQMTRGKLSALTSDSQVRWFLAILAGAVLTLTFWLVWSESFSLSHALRNALFNVTSIISTTGFASEDYSTWGHFPITFAFMLLVVGGCTGSTSGGIKIFRYQILYQTARAQIMHLIEPHAVIKPRYNGKPIPDAVMQSVMSFFILFALSFLIVALLLSFMGLDYITSMSSAATSLGNVGPALGTLAGPSGNFSSLPDAAKWLLSFAMLLGRLEIFTLLVLFTVKFWKD